MNCFHLRAPAFTPGCVGGVSVAHLLYFFCCLWDVRSVLWLISVTISALKLYSVRLYLKLFGGGIISCCMCFCLYVRIVMSSSLSFQMSLRSEFRIVMSTYTMLGSTLHTVVCRRVHVLLCVIKKSIQIKNKWEKKKIPHRKTRFKL